MTPFPRADYDALERYDPGRAPVEVDLSDNTNLWGTHPEGLARIRSADVEDLARYPTLYADELREAVSERFGVATECVATGAGSDDLLDSAFRAASPGGDVVTFPAPTFSMVEPLARMNGLTARPVEWADAVARPELLLAEGPAVVYLCSPNNPTGARLDRDWVEDLVGAAADTPSRPLVVIDEAYADFSTDSLLADAQGWSRTLVVRTASKALGLAGLRCGFAVGTPDTVEAVDKSRGPYKVSTLAASAVAAALRDPEGWLDGVIDEVVTNRERLSAELAGLGVDPLPSAANFVLFRAPSGSAADDTTRLRELGVGVRPFRAVPGLGDALRATVGPWPLMERLLAALGTRIGEVGA